jgi:hypothetical protein
MMRCKNYNIKHYSNSLAHYSSTRLFINTKGGAGNDIRRVCKSRMPEQSLEKRTRIGMRIYFRWNRIRITPIPIFNMRGI